MKPAAHEEKNFFLIFPLLPWGGGWAKGSVQQFLYMPCHYSLLQNSEDAHCTRSGILSLPVIIFVFRWMTSLSLLRTLYSGSTYLGTSACRAAAPSASPPPPPPVTTTPCTGTAGGHSTGTTATTPAARGRSRNSVVRTNTWQCPRPTWCSMRGVRTLDNTRRGPT